MPQIEVAFTPVAFVVHPGSRIAVEVPMRHPLRGERHLSRDTPDRRFRLDCGWLPDTRSRMVDLQSRLDLQIGI